MLQNSISKRILKSLQFKQNSTGRPLLSDVVHRRNHPITAHCAQRSISKMNDSLSLNLTSRGIRSSPVTSHLLTPITTWGRSRRSRGSESSIQTTFRMHRRRQRPGSQISTRSRRGSTVRYLSSRMQLNLQTSKWKRLFDSHTTEPSPQTKIQKNSSVKRNFKTSRTKSTFCGSLRRKKPLMRPLIRAYSGTTRREALETALKSGCQTSSGLTQVKLGAKRRQDHLSKTINE